ncbi:hypothetical protein GOBAR_AA19432 [Gossypium barbadense]|uniref:Uncharacterized protein n=1 Tax=Gossypium barbadense TaxID=3634 RepID=A0A2P5XD20_GOSBA|nr:hypothetical protein GOBAR_AA19432 [Gossypium barbadense]
MVFLYVTAGIVLFLIVEKLVRYVEENSGGASGWSHGHHHHHHKSNKNLKKKDEDAAHRNSSQPVGDTPDNSLNSDNATQPEIRKLWHYYKFWEQNWVAPHERKSSAGTNDGKSDTGFADGSANSVKTSALKETSHSPSNLVFGYLNLFSDGVHNFTDGMALGSAFLLHGSVGGWSRTLFLLAHELPQEKAARRSIGFAPPTNPPLRVETSSRIMSQGSQSQLPCPYLDFLNDLLWLTVWTPHRGLKPQDVGDFGILVRSGFSVSKALFFNFLSALVALAGTAMALLWGQDPGQSSLIECGRLPNLSTLLVCWSSKNCSLRCSQINGFSDPSKAGTSNFVYLGTTPIGRTTSLHGGGVAPPLTVGGKGAWCSQGFTAGGFIYIAVAGVLAEMNNNGKTTLKNTAVQLLSLASGMAVALCISLVE